MARRKQIRSGRSTILAWTLILGLGFAGCTQFRFSQPQTNADSSKGASTPHRILGVLYPADNRPSENLNPIPVGAFLPVPYVGLTVDRPERFWTMQDNGYQGTDRPLRLQLHDIMVKQLARSSPFETVVSIPASSNFKNLGCDRYLKLSLRSTRAKGAVPTYFVTYFGAAALYLVGFPYWVGTQELFIDAELMDGETLKPVWRKAYEKTSQKSWRGIYFYGDDPAMAANKLLEEFSAELVSDLRSTVSTDSRMGD